MHLLYYFYVPSHCWPSSRACGEATVSPYSVDYILAVREIASVGADWLLAAKYS